MSTQAPQLRLKNKIESIPGGFKWTVPETEVTIGPETNISDLLMNVRQHYRANDLLPPPDLEDRLEHDNCLRAPAKRCRPEHPSKAEGGWIARLTQDIGTILSGTLTIGQWLWQYGGESVSPEEAVRRAEICIRCPYNKPPQGCKPCNSAKIENTIRKVIGHRSTEHDNDLKSCAICGCHLRAKIWIPLEVMKKKSQPSRLKQYPQWCWLHQDNSLTQNSTES